MQVDKGQHRSEADAVVKAIRQQARENQKTGITQEEADSLLLVLRDAVSANKGARISPQFRAFLDAFETLDRALTAGFEHPTDWE